MPNNSILTRYKVRALVARLNDTDLVAFTNDTILVAFTSSSSRGGWVPLFSERRGIVNIYPLYVLVCPCALPFACPHCITDKIVLL